MASLERTSLTGTHVWMKASGLEGTREISRRAEWAPLSVRGKHQFVFAQAFGCDGDDGRSSFLSVPGTWLHVIVIITLKGAGAAAASPSGRVVRALPGVTHVWVTNPRVQPVCPLCLVTPAPLQRASRLAPKGWRGLVAVGRLRNACDVSSVLSVLLPSPPHTDRRPVLWRVPWSHNAFSCHVRSPERGLVWCGCWICTLLGFYKPRPLSRW